MLQGAEGNATFSPPNTHTFAVSATSHKLSHLQNGNLMTFEMGLCTFRQACLLDSLQLKMWAPWDTKPAARGSFLLLHLCKLPSSLQSPSSARCKPRGTPRPFPRLWPFFPSSVGLAESSRHTSTCGEILTYRRGPSFSGYRG